MEEVVVVADVHKECLQPHSTNSDMEEVVVVADVHKECLQPHSTNSDMEEVVVVADVHKEWLQPQSTNSDMEKVVVVADVHKEWLQPQSTNSNTEEVVVVADDVETEPLLPRSSSCDLEDIAVVVADDVDNANLPPPDTTWAEIEEKIEVNLDVDTIEAARKVRESQGNHEAEITFGGEADLHCHYRSCQKNPGHKQFVPVQDFKKKHLPPTYGDNVICKILDWIIPGYRHKIIVDWIRAEADLTCRLTVKHTSKHRPQFIPDSQPQKPYPFYGLRGTRTGTGWVANVTKYTVKDNQNCQCGECTRPGSHTQKKIWGEVVICTALHVVYDSDEARHTTCTFFYDTSATDVNKCPTLTGLKVEYSDIKGDMCMMTCVTHDMDFVDKLVKMCDRRLKIFEAMRDMYMHCLNRSDQCNSQLLVVISHPHGCPKHITVGEWTKRQKHGEKQKYEDKTGLKAEYIISSYKYNAATCPGSSGAPVIRLHENGRGKGWWLLYPHPHSKGNPNNDNSSGCTEEFVSFPPIPDDKFTKLGFTVFVLSLVLAFIITVAVVVVVTVKWEPYYMWIVPCIALIYVLCYWCSSRLRHRAVLLYYMVFIWAFALVPVLALVTIPMNNSDIKLTCRILTVVIGVICCVIMLLNYTNRITTPLKPSTTQRRLRQQPLKTTTATTIPHMPTTALTTSPPTTALITTEITIPSTEAPPLLQQPLTSPPTTIQILPQQPQQPPQ